MKEDIFLTRYNNLNVGQKEAVDTIEGPVMVIAGPGTGKTTVLTLRIANILRKTDTPPDGILALTFTESGVVSMRRKLVSMIGPAAYRVGIFTFHGFAEEIIRRFSEYFPRILGGSVATESEKLNIIEQIIEEGNFAIIKPFGSPLHYVRGALHTISDLKRDAVSPQGLLDVLLREEQNILSKEDLKHEKGKYKGEMKSAYKDTLKNIEKNRELANLYESYEVALSKKNFYDFDDMLLELLRAFKENPDLLQSVQEEYLYFLADEHQDANTAQNSILEQLSSYFDSPNLFIVGDEKQAIYRFQGASLENFLYFNNKFPTAKLIRLDENYRSHQIILDASHALAEPLPGDKALRPRLLSKGKKSKGSIDIISYQTEVDESVGLVDILQKEISKGRLPKEISILVRTNKEISDIGRILRDASLPVTLFQDEDVLNDPDVAKLFILMRSINDPLNDALLGETLFIDFLGLNPIEVIRNLHALRTNKKNTIDILDTFPTFKDQYTKWVTLSKNASALEVVTSILSDSNLREHLLLETNSIEKMALLSTLYQEIATRQSHYKDITLSVFLKDIDTLAEHKVKLSFASRLRKENTISVMTAHKSKGLEWETVVIPHAVAGKWGSKGAINDFRLPYPLGTTMQSGHEEDERRLFYVALTRAKEHVVITNSHLSADGRELIPTQFIEELPSELVNFIEGTEVGPTAPLLGALAKKVAQENTLWDEEYLKETFLEQGLNATALNNYIECPWKYFFKNLIRLPEVMEKHQMYGNAIHFALGEMTNALRLNKKFTEADLYKTFLISLDKQPLTEKDYKESATKGKAVLKAFWASEREAWHKEALTEYNIPGVHIELETGEAILLRGRLDKVDLLDKEPASVAQRVCVIDFKTGRSKSRNEILGETKSSNGNEKRQLDFYRLLLDLYQNGKYTMTGGTIIFTEPDEKGRIKKETFDMTAEDSKDVRELTKKVADEILNLAFWDKDCKDKDCEFCNLRKILI